MIPSNFDSLTREEYVRAVWDILVAECSADPDDFDSFSLHWPECHEYRFMGNQGFGGKIWSPSGNSPAYVTCYSENDNDVRKWARAYANGFLEQLTTPDELR